MTGPTLVIVLVMALPDAVLAADNPSSTSHGAATHDAPTGGDPTDARTDRRWTLAPYAQLGAQFVAGATHGYHLSVDGHGSGVYFGRPDADRMLSGGTSGAVTRVGGALELRLSEGRAVSVFAAGFGSGFDAGVRAFFDLTASPPFRGALVLGAGWSELHVVVPRRYGVRMPGPFMDVGVRARLGTTFLADWTVLARTQLAWRMSYEDLTDPPTAEYRFDWPAYSVSLLLQAAIGAAF